MIGQSISHYKILDKLGEGGMGIVYKAHDESLDRVVALKFLPPYLTSDPTEKERFYHEARAASALNHSNTTTIYEIAEHDGRLYMAMEYVEGVTLKQLIATEAIPLKKVLDIAVQTCDGLSAAHEKGIVHRDIKSDNIMITSKGQVKITDFGLAKVKGSTKLTKVGSTIGTAAYMSPEQAQGEEVDHRSDIFSFGVVLYELLTGRLPFRGEHQSALMYSLVNEDPQPVARFNNDVTPEIERIVLKALIKDKSERYQHIADMLADLRHERKGLEYASLGYVKAATKTHPAAQQKANSGMKKFMVPAGIIAVLVAVALIFNPFNLQISTQQSVAQPERASLAVLHFQNIPNPEDKNHPGDMLADLLITSLSQSREIEVISRERLYDILQELQTDSKSITPDIAAKVAQRAGVNTMLLGSIIQEQPSLMVTTRLIDVQTGKILKSERLAGFTSAQIFGLVDTIALLVRSELVATSSSPVDSRPIAEVTTNSPEAYRSYLEGVELDKKFFYAETRAAFRKAIELDSTFAMAYLAYAVANGDIPDELQASLITKAYSLRSKLPEREKLAIENTYIDLIENNPARSVELWQAYIHKFPREVGAYYPLRNAQAEAGNFEAASHTLQRGLKVDSLEKGLWNLLAYSYAGLHRGQEALSTIDRYLQIAPAEPNPYDSKGDIYFFNGDPDSAIIFWKKALEFRSDFPSSQKIAYQYLIRGDYQNFEKWYNHYAATRGNQEEQTDELKYKAVLLSVHTGKLRQAIRQMQDLIEADLAAGRKYFAFYDYRILFELGMEAGDAVLAEKYARKALQEKPSEIVPLAIALQFNGKQEEARALVTKLRGEMTGPLRERAPMHYVAGVLLYEQGNFDAALSEFNEALKALMPNHAPQLYLGLCYLKLGRTQDAIDEFKKCTWYTPLLHSTFDGDFLYMSGRWPTTGTKAQYWLGVANEQLGKKREARDAYEKFLTTWKDADFTSAEIGDARKRLTHLQTGVQ